MTPSTTARRPSADGKPVIAPGPRASAGIRGVLFDKDGTLIDFRATWLAAYQDIARELASAIAAPALASTFLERLGYEPTADRFAADSPLLWATNAAIAHAFAGQPELRALPNVEAVVAAHLEDFERYPPVPVGDLVPLFARLRASGLRLGVATMDWHAPALATLEALGIAPLLDLVLGADSGFGEKPNPGMVLAFCTATGLAPAEVAVIGDTAADLIMGRRAGAGLVVAVRTGGTPVESLTPLADHVLDRVTSIESVLPAPDGNGPFHARG